jgi:hypothetical protein
LGLEIDEPLQEAGRDSGVVHQKISDNNQAPFIIMREARKIKEVGLRNAAQAVNLMKGDIYDVLLLTGTE